MPTRLDSGLVGAVIGAAALWLGARAWKRVKAMRTVTNTPVSEAGCTHDGCGCTVDDERDFARRRRERHRG